MLPSGWKIKYLLGSILITVLVIDSGFAGHKHKDDDDDYDDDEGCYPGRNCRPGCYCGGSFCRPYFPPHSEHLRKYQCTGYNYPKWKVWKKGSKNAADNSTIMIVMAHHHEKLDPKISLFLKENNYTTYDTYELPVPTILMNLNNTSDFLPLTMNSSANASIIDLFQIQAAAAANTTTTTTVSSSIVSTSHGDKQSDVNGYMVKR